ncbi:hypothetical protein SAMN05192580_0607 [Sphingomonas jatrophae]|uniref:Uncharacterized protein n=1 Tax=Sphingomonas jatrophae TaxID=1166337 RepID=A0A1I6JP14_9SPHN|nr:hypothetical protein SAMN05192580_0607 [Sphingomonas jatrophae]
MNNVHGAKLWFEGLGLVLGGAAVSVGLYQAIGYCMACF